MEPEASKSADTDAMRRLIDCVRLVIPVSGLVFAFLLVMPFNARFVTVTQIDQTAYSVAYTSAGLATILLVAVGVSPIVRIARRGQAGADLRVVRRLAWIAVAGMGLLAISFISVVFLISDEVYHNSLLVAVGILLFIGAIVLTWMVLPVRARQGDGATEQAHAFPTLEEEPPGSPR